MKGQCQYHEHDSNQNLICTLNYMPCKGYENCKDYEEEGGRMKTCIICGKKTLGSIGAAGYSWSFICQPCKDSEDSLLKTRLKYEARVMDKISSIL